jgi:hypothetical protein
MSKTDSGDYTYAAGVTGAGAHTVTVGPCVDCEERAVAPHNGHRRWQKITMGLVALLCLTGGAAYAVQMQPASAAIIYASFAGAVAAIFGIFVTGNVGEHKVLGTALAMFGGKQPEPKP